MMVSGKGREPFVHEPHSGRCRPPKRIMRCVRGSNAIAPRIRGGGDAGSIIGAQGALGAGRAVGDIAGIDCPVNGLKPRTGEAPVRLPNVPVSATCCERIGRTATTRPRLVSSMK